MGFADNRTWSPTHRVVLLHRASGVQQGLFVMRTDAVRASSRYAWVNEHRATLLCSDRLGWCVSGSGELSSDSDLTIVRVDAIEALPVEHE